MKQNVLINRLTVSCFLEYGTIQKNRSHHPSVLLRIHTYHPQNAAFVLQDSSEPLGKASSSFGFRDDPAEDALWGGQ